MVMGLTQPLTEMSTRNIFWGGGGGNVGLTTLPPYVPTVLKSGSLNLLDLSRTVMGLLYLYWEEQSYGKGRQKPQGGYLCTIFTYYLLFTVYYLLFRYCLRIIPATALFGCVTRT